MIFKKLLINYKGQKKSFSFYNKTLIFSSENSVGKSTVLRLLFYSLGYPIPGTYKMYFKEVKTEIYFVNNRNNYMISRLDKDLKLFKNGKEIDYNYGYNDKWFSEIWGISSPHIVRNILGAIYMDQDKGWTLLNRGKVIGDISFNVRDLLIGLENDDLDPDPLLSKLDKLNNTYLKVKQLSKILEVSNEDNSNLNYDKGFDNDDVEYSNLKVEKNILKNDINDLESQLKSENASKKYILDANISIKHNGEIIDVNNDNILYVNDNIEYLNGKLSILKNKFQYLNYKINTIENKYSEDTETLFDEKDIIEDTLSKISNIKIKPEFLESRKKDLKKSISNLNDKIETEFIKKNNLIGETEEWILKFAKILGVDDVIASKKYVFTRNIKSISGTIFYKIVFCFKMSYIKMIEKYTNISLPIVLDSPSGREVTDRNINAVIDILNKYFKENQIIIASIKDYNLNDVHKIIINNSIFGE